MSVCSCPAQPYFFTLLFTGRRRLFLTDGSSNVCVGRPSDVAELAAMRLERRASKAAASPDGEQNGRRRSSVIKLLGRK